MKFTAFIFILAFSCNLQAKPINDAFISKTLKIDFESDEKAKEWSLRELPFGEWVNTVSDSNWTELHKSQTTDFYYAIYRSGSHLILCVNDRNNTYFDNTYFIDTENHDRPWAEPIVVPTVEWKLTYPNGSVDGQKIFATWKILDDYRGRLTIRFKAQHSRKKGIETFKKNIEWN